MWPDTKREQWPGRRTKIKHANKYTDGGTDSHAKGRAQPTGASVSMHACVVSATAISLHGPRHTHLCCLRCAPSLLAAACGKKQVRRHTSKKCLHQLLLCCSAARGSGNTATLAVSMPAPNSLCRRAAHWRGARSGQPARNTPIPSHFFPPHAVGAAGHAGHVPPARCRPRQQQWPLRGDKGNVFPNV